MASESRELAAVEAQMLDALEACRARFVREIAGDIFLRSFFGDEISPRGCVPFLIPQHGCIPEFLKVCAAIDAHKMRPRD